VTLQDGVVVTGTGRASAPTDVVRAALGAESRQASVAAALDGAARAAAAMRAALLAAGVAEGDVVVESTSVNHEPWEREVQPYVGRAALAVTLRDPDGAGALVSAAVAAGGDAARLDGLRRALDRPEDLAPRARRAAVADARARAEELAGLLGRSLGRALAVLEVVDGAAQPWEGPERMALATAGAPAPVPFEAGSASVTAAVRVRWELV
jgi:hypothetical protein